MSKILVGYIVEDDKPDYNIPKDTPFHYNYRLKLYGIKAFNTASNSEVVLKYSDLNDEYILGLDSEIFKNSEYAHLYFYIYEDGDKDIDIITDNLFARHYSSPLVPIYNKDSVIIDNWSYKCIGYYGDIGGSYLENCSLIYNILENEIDLEFCCFSMLHSDFRYLQKNYTYYNAINGDIDLAWFDGNDIRDLGLVYKFNSICAAYKFGGDIILPEGCKLFCNWHSTIIKDSYDNKYNSIVINHDLEYICTSEYDEPSIDKLYLCKRTYGNIKVVDTFNSVIESHDSIEDLENRLRTIGKELAFY